MQGTTVPMVTRKLTRGATACLAVIVLTLAWSGCGATSGVVVQVGPRAISRAMLDHWLPIQATLLYKLKPSKPVPKGVVPDPPNYTNCIAFLAASTPKFLEGPTKATNAQLKARCRKQYQTVLQTVLDFLIEDYWVIGEGAERGLKVTEREARQWLATVERVEYPAPGEFHLYLRYSGETIADMLFRARVKLLEQKLAQAQMAGKGKQQGERALIRFGEEHAKKWLAKTTCRGAYVAPDCRQYAAAAGR